MREAGCWAHLQRDFHDVGTSSKSEIACAALDRIRSFFDIKRDIAGQPVDLGLRAYSLVAVAMIFSGLRLR